MVGAGQLIEPRDVGAPCHRSMHRKIDPGDDAEVLRHPPLLPEPGVLLAVAVVWRLGLTRWRDAAAARYMADPRQRRAGGSLCGAHAELLEQPHQIGIAHDVSRSG